MRPCPCCGCLTASGDIDGICPVCWWQDDGERDPDAPSGANGRLSLREGRRNYLSSGAVDERFRAYARPPTPDERP